MTPAVQSMVATTYVKSIDVSRAFYELLGFREQSVGRADTAAWLALYHNGHYVLLASTDPPLPVPPLPLLFYFWYDDLDAVAAGLEAAGVDVARMGHPPHALGGEAKLLDPDGNTLLLGQRERSPSQPPAADEDPATRFSLLREAAALVRARGGTTAGCQIGNSDGTPCRAKADVKLADTTGAAAWACFAHADEILVMVRGAFLANPGDQGIAAFVASRGQGPS
jgi:catechol 2,3-dioxygenase-like lactoylglutathione lyase family enzyme